MVEETEGNYSVLTLTCILGGTFADPLPDNQRPATFLKNGSEITMDNVVFLKIVSDVQVVITFNAEQEGEFSCKSGGELPSVESDCHFLAGIYVQTLSYLFLFTVKLRAA